MFDYYSHRRTIGIDGSTTKTGWSVYDDEILIDHGCIDMHTNKDSKSRRMEMLTAIENLLDWYSPDYIIIEETYIAENPASLKVLEKLLAGVEIYAYRHGIKYEEIPASTWRKANCEAGEKAPYKREDAKRWSKAKVKQLYGCDVSDDEADAILIGRAAVK